MGTKTTVPKKNDSAQKDAPEEKPKETTVEFLASLAAVLVTGLFIITFVVQAFEIPSSSMEETLLIGDHVFVNRIQFSPDQVDWAAASLSQRSVPGHCGVSVSGNAGPVCREANHRVTRRPDSPQERSGLPQRAAVE